LNDIGRNSSLGNRKKIAKFLMRTSTFPLYLPLWPNSFSVSGPFALPACPEVESQVDGATCIYWTNESGVSDLTNESRVSVHNLLPTCQTSFVAVDRNQFYVIMQINLDSNLKQMENSE
jgi:hypothetical protein